MDDQTRINKFMISEVQSLQGNSHPLTLRDVMKQNQSTQAVSLLPPCECVTPSNKPKVY